MSGRSNPITAIVGEAIHAGKPLEVAKIKQLRAESKRAVTIFKSIFWVGIVIFNLLLWAPLPIVVAKTVLYTIAFIVLAIALVVPIIGLRKHQMNLELLKVNKDTLKRKTVNETGRVYMDKVKSRDRPLINAEFELLNGSKWSDGAELDD
jgi:hypothetical protein